MVLKKVSTKKKVAIGTAVGLATAAAAAGYYFCGAKDAAKHRAKAAIWAKKMKSEVVKKTKEIKKLDKKAIHAIIGEVSKAYTNVKSVNPAHLKKAVKELQANWQELHKEASGTIKKMAKKKVTRSKKA
ncbi:MAG: hypothetical protein ABI747_00190 [Candidatus Moraniibacteriota bacterium]